MYKQAQNSLNKANTLINHIQASPSIEDTQLMIDNVVTPSESTDDTEMDFVQGGR